MIVQIFVTQGQAVETLLDQLLDRMIGETPVARVVEAGGERARQTQCLVDLAQQQRAPVARKRAARKVGDHFAWTQVLKKQGLVTTLCRGSCGG